MPRKSNYEIIHSSPKLCVIKDVGPWDEFLSVTNDAENVVAELYREAFISNDTMLLYYDSCGQLDRIRHENGVFKRF